MKDVTGDERADCVGVQSPLKALALWRILARFLEVLRLKH
jgi:hypothetical protein